MNTFDLGILVRDTLLHPEEKAFQRGIDTLIAKNMEIIPYSKPMFMFAGYFYRASNVKESTTKASPLDISLVGEMQDNIKMFKDSVRETRVIWQALLPIIELHGANNGLPDNLKTVLPAKFEPRTLSFEDALKQCSTIAQKNWQDAEKLVHYFISLRLAL